MDNDWDVIPQRFHYFRPAVQACGETRIAPFDHSLNRHVPFVERMTPEQFCCLTLLHAEIMQRDDALAITAWCESTLDGTQEEKNAAGRICGILSIIDQLAENEITPFCNAPLEKPEPKPFDETPELQLPHELEYLIGPALHFGERYQSELQMTRFFEEASPQERDQLAVLAKRVRQNDDWPKVLQWFQAVAARNVRYCHDIDRLFNLMDLCDFEFES